MSRTVVIIIGVVASLCVVALCIASVTAGYFVVQARSDGPLAPTATAIVATPGLPPGKVVTPAVGNPEPKAVATPTAALKAVASPTATPTATAAAKTTATPAAAAKAGNWEVVVRGNVQGLPLGGMTSIALERNGNLLVADADEAIIYRFSPRGQLVDRIQGQFGNRLLFRNPYSIAVDPTDGSILVADYDADEAIRIAPDGSRVIGSATPNGVIGIWAVAVDAQGQLYTTQAEDGVLRKFNARGQELARFETVGQGRGQLALPFDITVDRQGNVWVTDKVNHKVMRFDANLRFVSEFGRKGSAPGELDTPEGIAVDAQGNVYVSELVNARIQKFSPDGRSLATWGSEGSGAGQFDVPLDLVVDERGAIWVADAGNRRIQRLQQ
jgi:DNA-binding beta-propeller fold protein YncE